MRAALVVLVAATGLAAGCGGSSHRAAGDGVDEHMCAAYGAEAQAIFSGSGAERACDELVRRKAAAGSFWTRHDRDAGVDRAVVCRLARDDRAELTLTVLDLGGAYVGSSLCAEYIARGWREL